MKKSLLLITAILTGTIDNAFAGGNDPILAHTWELNGSKVIFGLDNSYHNTNDGAHGGYTVGKALSGGDHKKTGEIGLRIDKATANSWPVGNYSTCPVVWERQDWMISKTKIKTYQVPDPNDPDKMVTVEEPYTVDEKVGDKFVLTVTCDPGVLTLTRTEEDPKKVAAK